MNFRDRGDEGGRGGGNFRDGGGGSRSGFRGEQCIFLISIIFLFYNLTKIVK